MIGTANWIEIFGFLMSFVAMIYYIRNWREAIDALNGLLRSGKNGGYKIAALRRRRNQLERLGFQTLLFAVWITAMLIPEPTNPNISFGRWLTNAIFIAVQGWMLLGARMDLESDKKLEPYLEPPKFLVGEPNRRELVEQRRNDKGTEE